MQKEADTQGSEEPLMVAEKVSGFRQAARSTSKGQQCESSVFCSTSPRLNSSMTAQKWKFGRTGGRRERLYSLEQLGKNGEERKEPYASAAMVWSA